MNTAKVKQMVAELNLVHWYQPIYCLDSNETIGYEALLRSSSSRKFSPFEFLDHAQRNGYIGSLDRVLLEKAQQTAGSHVSCSLFLNVYPSTLLSSGFLSWWDKNMNQSTSIVLEISESEKVNDWKALRAIIEELRCRGVKVALDDMGIEYCFLRHWIELEPEYIKLDRYYTMDIWKSHIKQKVLRGLGELLSYSTQLIIEGLETEEELQFVKEMGIQYAQGYYLGKPAPWHSLNICDTEDVLA